MFEHWNTHRLAKRADGRLFARDLKRGFSEIFEPKDQSDLYWKTIWNGDEYISWGADRGRGVSLNTVVSNSLNDLRSMITLETQRYRNALS